MTYASGTFTGTTTPAKSTMEGWLHTALAAGLTYVEEVTNGTVTARVYKSAVGTNGIGDWYVFTYRTSDAATSVQFGVFETWDGTGKRARHYIPTTSVTPNSADSFRVNDATGVLLAPLGALNYRTLTIAAASTNYQYWISVTDKRVAVGTRVGSTGYGLYCGLLRNVIPTSVVPSAAVQLCVYDASATDQSGLVSVSANGGGFTREPGQTAASVNNFTAAARQNAGYTFGFLSSGIEALYSGRAYAAPQTITSGRNPGAGTRGITYDALLYAPGSNVGGDTATLTDPFTGTTSSWVCLVNNFWVNTAV